MRERQVAVEGGIALRWRRDVALERYRTATGGTGSHSTSLRSSGSSLTRSSVSGTRTWNTCMADDPVGRAATHYVKCRSAFLRVATFLTQASCTRPLALAACVQTNLCVGSEHPAEDIDLVFVYGELPNCRTTSIWCSNSESDFT